jgi:hypothetical protein
MHVIHRLLPPDCGKQSHYCKWLMEKEDDDPLMLDWTFFADEAWFRLTEYINSQKTCLWSTENPHVHETVLLSVKNGLWILSCCL